MGVCNGKGNRDMIRIIISILVRVCLSIVLARELLESLEFNFEQIVIAVLFYVILSWVFLIFRYMEGYGLIIRVIGAVVLPIIVLVGIPELISSWVPNETVSLVVNGVILCALFLVPCIDDINRIKEELLL